MLTVLLNKSNETDLKNKSFDSRQLYNENQTDFQKEKPKTTNMK
jgi:hypothetical protein